MSATPSNLSTEPPTAAAPKKKGWLQVYLIRLLGTYADSRPQPVASSVNSTSTPTVGLRQTIFPGRAHS